MKKILTSLMLSMLLILALTTIGLAQLEHIFPLVSSDTENYYVKAQITTGIKGVNPIITENYYLENIAITKQEFGDYTIEYQLEMTDTWTPEYDYNLLFANYKITLAGIQQVADRTGLVIEIYQKTSNQLVAKYVIDQATNVILNQYSYDSQGTLVLAFETLEINFDPDISAIDLENIPKYTITDQHHPLTQTEFLASVPWINLSSLPLLPGYQIAGYSLIEDTQGFHHQTTAMTNLQIWLSDGHYVFTIIVTVDPSVEIIVAENTALEIVENTYNSLTVSIPNQPANITISGGNLTQDQFIEISQAITNTNLILNHELLIQNEQQFAQLDILDIDYESIAQRSLTRTEFYRLAPRILLGNIPLPDGFQIVDLAAIDFPEEIKELLYPYQEHPDITIHDLLIKLSDGEKFHYIGIAYGRGDQRYKTLNRNIDFSTSGVVFTMAEIPCTVFSFSDFLSFRDQLKILEALLIP